MNDGKIRYTSSEAKSSLGIGNNKFWKLVSAGLLKVYYDGNRAYVTKAELERYDATCHGTTERPGGKRSVQGKRGVQRSNAPDTA